MCGALGDKQTLAGLRRRTALAFEELADASLGLGELVDEFERLPYTLEAEVKRLG